MKKTLWSVLFAAILSGNVASGQAQSVVLEEISFADFITFYVSSVDVSTGATDVQLFEYQIYPVGGTAWIQVEFNMFINSVPLGLTYEDEFLHVKTEVFPLDGTVRVRNTDLDLNTDELTYVDGRTVPVKVEEQSTIFDAEPAQMEQIQSTIMTSGRLPDGTYRFEINVDAWADEGHSVEIPVDVRGEIPKVIISAHPISLELISPGGPLEDTTNTAITTTYPFFQWESDPCPICTYQIRVAEFKPDEHSSMEDAIEDQTVLPLDQALGYHDVGQSTSMQYPQTDAIDLEPGHIYVWQAQKSIPTTEGDETVSSFILAFQIVDPTRTAPAAAGAGVVVQGPILTFLQNAMGAENFDQSFSAGGDLEGYRPNQVIILNGESLDPSQLSDLNTALQQGGITIISQEVQ
jgi:hypothetical protein